MRTWGKRSETRGLEIQMCALASPLLTLRAKQSGQRAVLRAALGEPRRRRGHHAAAEGGADLRARWGNSTRSTRST